jgi:N-acetylmuramoyl-L-alanine amidase
MKIAIDAGHGMGNARRGVFDPGATAKAGAHDSAEADIVLGYAHALAKLCEKTRIEFFLTRSSSTEPAPVGGRAARAGAAGCTRFVSIHLNSSGQPRANGLEVLYRDEKKDRPLAAALQQALLKVTGFRDRGNDRRTDLAVLKFKQGPAVLIELGFISNKADREFLLAEGHRDRVSRTILQAVASA